MPGVDCCWAGVVAGSRTGPRHGRHLRVRVPGADGGRQRGGRAVAAALPQGAVQSVARRRAGRRRHRAHLPTDHTRRACQRVHAQIGQSVVNV